MRCSFLYGRNLTYLVISGKWVGLKGMLATYRSGRRPYLWGTPGLIQARRRAEKVQTPKRTHFSSEQGCPASAFIQEGVHTRGGADAFGPAQPGLGIGR